MSARTEMMKVNLPALAAGSSGPPRGRSLEIAPGPLPGNEALATLLGVARTLPLLYRDLGAISDPERLDVLADPRLAQRVTTCLRTTPTARPMFCHEVLSLNAYWLAASVTVVERDLIARTRPSPRTISGYSLADVLDGARHLASLAPPFDRAESTIVHLLEVTGHAQ